MNYPTYYEFLEMDLNDNNKLIIDMINQKIEHLEKGEVDKSYEIGRQMDIFQALLTLQLNGIIYKDEWRDKWVIKHKED